MLKPPFPSVTWTDESIDHIARHGVSEADVEDVLYSRPRHWAEGRDDTTLVYGQTGTGRYLTVIIVEAEDGGVFVVTAREMTTSEKRLFREKGH